MKLGAITLSPAQKSYIAKITGASPSMYQPVLTKLFSSQSKTAPASAPASVAFTPAPVPAPVQPAAAPAPIVAAPVSAPVQPAAAPAPIVAAPVSAPVSVPVTPAPAIAPVVSYGTAPIDTTAAFSPTSIAPPIATTVPGQTDYMTMFQQVSGEPAPSEQKPVTETGGNKNLLLFGALGLGALFLMKKKG